jgi:hypothetical protein
MADDIEANYCYIADGANSLQQDIMAHLFLRRNRQTGRLESMALAVDACTYKTATGQHRGLEAAQKRIADACAAAEALGLLGSAAASAQESQPDPETPEQSHRQRRDEMHRRIKFLVPTDSQNDRNAGARKAARLARGGDGTGGENDVEDRGTCAHHGVANIGEAGRKSIDGVLKTKMNISEEASAADAAKVKACGPTSAGLVHQRAHSFTRFASSWRRSRARATPSARTLRSGSPRGGPRQGWCVLPALCTPPPAM